MDCILWTAFLSLAREGVGNYICSCCKRTFAGLKLLKFLIIYHNRILLLFTPIHLTPYHLTPIYSPTPVSFNPSIITSRQIAVDIKGMFCHN